METLNAWNDRKFAQRSAEQTPQQSLAELYESRDIIRRVTSQMTDEDLSVPLILPHHGGMGHKMAYSEFLPNTRLE